MHLGRHCEQLLNEEYEDMDMVMDVGTEFSNVGSNEANGWVGAWTPPSKIKESVCMHV